MNIIKLISKMFNIKKENKEDLLKKIEVEEKSEFKMILSNKEFKCIIGMDLATEYLEIDPKVKLQKKLQLIAKRTKNIRIRRKNIKRLVSLFGKY